LKTVQKSAKLANVCYDIRGPIMDAARQMEEEGHKIIKLNIGNLAVFGFRCAGRDSAGHDPQPAEFGRLFRQQGHLRGAQGGDALDPEAKHQGRDARRHLPRQRRVSELIVMAMNALLNNGDECCCRRPTIRCGRRRSACRVARRCITFAMKPRAGCPTWTTSVARSRPATKGIVVINPNNPTGALYPDELLQKIVALAREHDLVIFADEVYDKVLYDGNRHTAIASCPTMC
jgi:alanine-synthesizing transaminase